MARNAVPLVRTVDVGRLLGDLVPHSRKAHSEGGSRLLSGMDLQGTAVQSRDLACDIQPQTQAGLVFLSVVGSGDLH